MAVRTSVSLSCAQRVGLSANQGGIRSHRPSWIALELLHSAVNRGVPCSPKFLPARATPCLTCLRRASSSLTSLSAGAKITSTIPTATNKRAAMVMKPETRAAVGTPRKLSPKATTQNVLVMMPPFMMSPITTCHAPIPSELAGNGRCEKRDNTKALECRERKKTPNESGIASRTMAPNSNVWPNEITDSSIAHVCSAVSNSIKTDCSSTKGTSPPDSWTLFVRLRASCHFL
mmetsp:Transcript_19142/g.34671  ORF Transcript_19142/g.34671 Transcript_19142/m.34671 type:complete len:232 (-) Transcript_19142:611-1306(-)